MAGPIVVGGGPIDLTPRPPANPLEAPRPLSPHSIVAEVRDAHGRWTRQAGTLDVTGLAQSNQSVYEGAPPPGPDVHFPRLAAVAASGDPEALRSAASGIAGDLHRNPMDPRAQHYNAHVQARFGHDASTVAAMQKAELTRILREHSNVAGRRPPLVPYSAVRR